VNAYVYVDANPIGLIDYYGLFGSKKGFYAHQRVGIYVFGNHLDAIQRNMAWQGQVWADNDEHQKSEYSYMHAMSNSTLTPQQACKKSNDYIQKVAQLAVDAKMRGKKNESIFLFAVALHTMQDSVSLAHRGFQKWTGEEEWYELIWHFLQEAKTPLPGSDLHNITQRAWTSFQNNNSGGFKMDCQCE
jgi:hypothetical protein